MKIAMMTNNYKPFIGGVPISVERLSEDIRKLGHEVIVFAPTYEEQEEEEYTVRYSSLLEGVAGGIVIPNPLDSRIEKVFKEEKFDLIHVHHPVIIGRTARYLSKKYNIPLVFTYHTRYEQYLHYAKLFYKLDQGGKKEGRLGSIQRRLMYRIREKAVPAYLNTFVRHCDHIFTPTKGIMEYVAEKYPAQEGNCCVLPTGLSRESYGEDITPKQMENLRKSLGAEGIALFISVSRISREKNIPFLLNALAYYKESYGKPFKMLFVGEGPDRKEYEEECIRLGMGEDIIFTGKIPNRELPLYYKSADLFLFASKTETQGIVLTEAMAAETPVIGVCASGVSDIVEGGVNGYTTKEVEMEFAERMDEVMEDTALYSRLKEGAVRTAISYSGENIARRALLQYEAVVRSHTMTSLIVNPNIRVYN